MRPEKELTCRLCGHRVEVLCRTPSPHHPAGPILHCFCAGCGSVVVGNNFTDEELGAAYQALPASSYYESIRETNSRKMRRCLLDILGVVPSSARVLDIGTGDGQFPAMLREAGFGQVAGHELPGTDTSRLAELGVECYLDTDYRSIPDSSFDLVTLLDVAEHVPDPGYLFRECARILRPGGHVYLHTPVVTRLDRCFHWMARSGLLLHVAEIWQSGRTSIFHLQNYSCSGLEGLLERSGFREVTFRTENELSWPVSLYVKTYLIEKFGLPEFLVWPVTLLVYPLLATNLFNSNKAIVLVRKDPAEYEG